MGSLFEEEIPLGILSNSPECVENYICGAPVWRENKARNSWCGEGGSSSNVDIAVY